MGSRSELWPEAPRGVDDYDGCRGHAHEGRDGPERAVGFLERASSAGAALLVVDEFPKSPRLALPPRSRRGAVEVLRDELNCSISGKS